MSQHLQKFIFLCFDFPMILLDLFIPPAQGKSTGEQRLNLKYVSYWRKYSLISPMEVKILTENQTITKKAICNTLFPPNANHKLGKKGRLMCPPHKAAAFFQGYRHHHYQILLLKLQSTQYYPAQKKTKYQYFSNKQPKNRTFKRSISETLAPTLIKRLKATFFWPVAITASVNDCAALLNSTCRSE